MWLELMFCVNMIRAILKIIIDEAILLVLRVFSQIKFTFVCTVIVLPIFLTISNHIKFSFSH